MPPIHPAPEHVQPVGSALGRRTLLRGGVAALAAGAGGGLLSACTGGDDSSAPTAGAALVGSGDARTIKIGYVTPQSGPLSLFGEADSFVVDSVRTALTTRGLTTGAGVSAVDIVIQDTGSDPQAAAAAADKLITDDRVDVVLVSSTPDTTNPVADRCEAAGVPCISTVAPWQSYFFGRGASAVSSFTWTYHFFWGLEDIEAVFIDMWDEVDSNGRVGALWPNDADGSAWGDPATGFLPSMTRRGYGIVDPGLYDNGSTDFSVALEQFKAQGAEILVGVPVPPDFPTFWQQAEQAEFRPRLATVGKALLFPAAVGALGERGNNLATEVWWSPTHPFTSSLTGETAADLAASYTDSTGRQWTQPIGLVHALFEVTAAALAGADSPDDKRGIVDTLSRLSIDTVCGPLDWNSGPVPNVSKIPLVGGQWRVQGDDVDLVVVSNAQALAIPKASDIQPLA